MRSTFGADILAKTYYHRVTAYRPLPEGGEQVLCQETACSLSRSAHVSAPAPSDTGDVLPEAAYRLSLFTRPEQWFRLGDRLEVTDTHGRVYHGYAADSVCYPTHCVTVMEIREVLGGDEETGVTA